MIIFLAIGGLSGYFSDRFKKMLKLNRTLISVNQETMVPNTNFMDLIPESKITYTVASVIISDRNNINEVFGFELFNRVVNLTYVHLIKGLPQESYVMQSDSHLLWVMIPFQDTKKDTESIIAALDTPIIVNDVNIFVEYYIGAGKSSTLLECKTMNPFRESDRFARFAEKNNLPYAYYDESKAVKQHQFNLLSEFKNALDSNETYLTYHPIIDLTNMSIYQFEALIRWQHPQKGLIMPNDFIPLVENTQLVHPLVDWVVNTGLVKLHEFNEKEIKIRFAFNISAQNFNDLKLYDKIVNFLKNNSIQPDQVSLEITETVLMRDPETSKVVIKRFKDLGVTIAIDDFGKGYSSFAYLSQFEIDYVKIDRYFISHIKDKAIFKIVEASINLAHQLKFKVIAEGVETLEALDIVRKLKCDFAQGFYFSKPVHQDDVINYYLTNPGFEEKQNES
ncbi:MAG: EAL domain-containing protein [Bacilli bacterium]|nr:EAL domain-containing protein [Bacilli bacterium]MBN2876893.1 EAL domain-containing protein [Bacilli bacterium]